VGLSFLFLIGYCLKKPSPLKLLGKMEPNLAGSIYARSSIKLLHFITLKNSSHLEWRVGLSDTILKGHTQGPSMPELNTLHRCFLPSLAPFGQQIWLPRLILFSEWLMLKKSSPLKQLGQMEPNLAGSIYVRSKSGIDGKFDIFSHQCLHFSQHPIDN
jgi:hypothetical protein